MSHIMLYMKFLFAVCSVLVSCENIFGCCCCCKKKHFKIIMFTADYKNTFDRLKKVFPSAEEDICCDVNNNNLLFFSTLTIKYKGYSFDFWFYGRDGVDGKGLGSGLVGQSESVDGLFFVEEYAKTDQNEKFQVSSLFLGGKDYVAFLYLSKEDNQKKEKKDIENNTEDNQEKMQQYIKKNIEIPFPKVVQFFGGNEENLKEKICLFFEAIIKKKDKQIK